MVVTTTMRRSSEAVGDLAKLLGAVAETRCAGGVVDFAAMRGGSRWRVHLPAYPFDRARFWGLRGTGFTLHRTRGVTLAGKTTGPTTQTSLAVDRLTISGALRSRPLTVHDRVLPAGTLAGPPVGPPGWLYATRWRPEPAMGTAAASPARVILLSDRAGATGALADRLGAEVVVTAENAFQRIAAGRFAVDPARREDLEAVLATVDGDVHVISAFALDAPSGPDGLERALELGYFSAVALVQALGARRAGRTSLSLLTVRATSAGGTPPRPAASMLVGLMRVLASEYPAIDVSLIDLARGELDRPEDRELLVAAVQRTGRAPLLAIRGGERLVPVHEPLAPAAPPEVPVLQPGGVYVITGGRGGIGITLANHLARTYAARLVLASRHGLPPRETWPALLARPANDARRRELEAFLELQASGAEVVIHEADVADRAQAQELVHAALRRFGTINGVIHAAGVTGGGAIQRRTREESLAILRPKVHGTLALDAALRDVPIDFFLLCSSLTAILGGFGQADYAAANSFQDAFAESANAEGGRLVVSIGWDGWREVGAAARHAQAETQEQDTAEKHPLLGSSRTTDEGRIFTTGLSPALWLLRDHRVAGRHMLPGTAYVELVFAAAHAMGLEPPFHAREITLLTPLYGDASKQLYTEVTREGDDLSIRCMSEAGPESSTHALAKLSLAHPSRPAPLDLDSLLADPAARRTSLPSRLHAGGIEVGPRWSCLCWWRETATGTFGRFQLPREFQAEAGDFWVHPALMDATSSVLRLEGEVLFVPFGYRDLILYERLPATVYCHASLERRPTGLEAQLVLAADDGRIVASVGGYLLRPLQPRTQEEG